ncbi:tRNA-binding protein [Deinococcus metalli]|uniref:tRNA-binding protein n=1 Tax=Deinococcus metalli TaxID=1141878 RepID=A0A7W8KE95_9DEIO|nr:tRNA-binding protein [Deinococcus metalli]MBB5376335.1 tRNA-binding protein [Deinococcus metalli]GHF39058.1 tRNA-binding protein [Deinococcus metalli]
MATEVKDTVGFDETLGRLDIRVGRVVDVQPAVGAPKASYRLTIDFGKFGRRVSIGRFTGHAATELLGRQVVGVLNFEPREIGGEASEVLVLGVQLPGAPSGEATFLTPAAEAKIGSKVF